MNEFLNVSIVAFTGDENYANNINRIVTAEHYKNTNKDTIHDDYCAGVAAAVCYPRSALYRILHELFSRNGFTFWLEKPTSKQSSCSCSVTYLTISAQACDTAIRCMDASRRSWSTILLCCCKLVAIRSITAVSERPMVNNLRWLCEG